MHPEHAGACERVYVDSIVQHSIAGSVNVRFGLVVLPGVAYCPLRGVVDRHEGVSIVGRTELHLVWGSEVDYPNVLMITIS
jgi:hypothetical protein